MSIIPKSHFLLRLNPSICSFNGWNFYVGNDPNNTANVNYLDRDSAFEESLVFVNDANRAIVKVDNTTDGRGDINFGRKAVRILSDWTFSAGSLVLFDAVHMPFGVRISSSISRP